MYWFSVVEFPADIARARRFQNIFSCPAHHTVW